MSFLNLSSIHAETRLLGLIGEKVSYSVSPMLHNCAASQLGVSCVYLAFSLPRKHIQNFLEAAWEFNAIGFNVTQPYKEYVASLIETNGRKSVNTIYRGAHGWCATSTDGQGFDNGLELLGRDLSSFQKVVFLGSGGAVTAILEYLLISLGQKKTLPQDIAILRRSPDHDWRFNGFKEAGLNIRFGDLSPITLTKELSQRGSETLCVQATSAPLRGDSMEIFLGALDHFRGVFVDLVYGNPSSLYFRAKALNLVTQDGEPMLIEQARLAQAIWWGKSDSYSNLAAYILKK